MGTNWGCWKWDWHWLKCLPNIFVGNSAEQKICSSLTKHEPYSKLHGVICLSSSPATELRLTKWLDKFLVSALRAGRRDAIFHVGFGLASTFPSLAQHCSTAQRVALQVKLQVDLRVTLRDASSRCDLILHSMKQASKPACTHPRLVDSAYPFVESFLKSWVSAVSKILTCIV